MFLIYSIFCPELFFFVEKAVLFLPQLFIP